MISIPALFSPLLPQHLKEKHSEYQKIDMKSSLQAYVKTSQKANTHSFLTFSTLVYQMRHYSRTEILVTVRYFSEVTERVLKT